MNQDQFKIGNRSMTRLWHCFGNQRQSCDLDAAVNMLNASKTNVLPLNTHEMKAGHERDKLQLGYSGVTLDDLALRYDVSKLHLMLNINLQTTARSTVDKTLMACEASDARLIKIEVLSAADIDKSDDSELIAAVAELAERHPELTIIPLCSAEPSVAAELVEIGCPALRVMGSPIGSMAGIAQPEDFKLCCNLGVPVILDGGVGHIDHLIDAMALGAEGCLVNSMLFSDPRGPAAAMEDFARSFREKTAALSARANAVT
jgi:thiazole synthase ThiGH ThiG subunit